MKKTRTKPNSGSKIKINFIFLLTNRITYNINVYIKHQIDIRKYISFANLRGGELSSMSSEEIFEKVKKIIVDLLNVEEDTVTLEAHFIDDLGADSLDLVELIMGIEEEFNIEIPDGEAEKVVTVGDVVDYIKENVE